MSHQIIVDSIEKYSIDAYIHHFKSEHADKLKMVEWYLSSPKALVSLMIVTFVYIWVPKISSRRLLSILKASALKATSISSVIKNVSENKLLEHEFIIAHKDFDFKTEFLNHCFLVANISKSMLQSKVNQKVH